MLGHKSSYIALASICGAHHGSVCKDSGGGYGGDDVNGVYGHETSSGVYGHGHFNGAKDGDSKFGALSSKDEDEELGMDEHHGHWHVASLKDRRGGGSRWEPVKGRKD